jgi:hypothetical protein
VLDIAAIFERSLLFGVSSQFIELFNYSVASPNLLGDMVAKIVRNAKLNQAGCSVDLQSRYNLSNPIPEDEIPDHREIMKVRGTGFLRRRLTSLYNRTVVSNIKTEEDLDLKCDFELFTMDGSVRVHSWVLYSRWNWFRKMVDSGLYEAQNGVATLPSDSLSIAELNSIIKFIYTNRIDGVKREQNFCQNLFDNAQYFGIIDAQQTSQDPFEPLVYHIRLNLGELRKTNQ